MRERALWFSYNGFSSEEFNIIKVNFESSAILTETLIPSRNVNKTQRQNTSTTDFYSVTESPLSFTITCCFNGDFTEMDRIKVIRWLKQNTYKKLVFESKPDDVYYAIPTSIDFSHNTIDRGYFTVGFECNSPYPYTNILMTQEYVVSSSDTINIQSNSVFDTRIVKVMMEVNGNGNILIKNTTNNTELRFENLVSGTKITADCYNHILSAVNGSGESILINDNKTSHSWLELMAENNNITITGNCTLKIFWQGVRI